MIREIKLLDHGYIRLIETWGSDERIIEAARMSTDKGFQGWGDCDEPGDEKLLRYLWENKHSTPFEMAGAIIEVQAPIFVFREWHRHRTQSYSELSARYTPLPDLNYVPTVQRLMQGSDGKNKQAGTITGALSLTVENAERYRAAIIEKYRNDQELYEQFLKAGVPKELARAHLPVARYSRMRAGAVLRNWFGFLSLRMPANAQHEIRVYADALLDLLSDRFPRSHALFCEDSPLIRKIREHISSLMKSASYHRESQSNEYLNGCASALEGEAIELARMIGDPCPIPCGLCT